jgi:hypothetical protein
MRSIGGLLMAVAALALAGDAPSRAQPPVASLTARPIDPGSALLPAESASAAASRFSFIAYGDTRGQADGRELQVEHGRIVDSMIATVAARASTAFPVRFIVQSGDAVSTGAVVEQWDVSFTPIIERLTRETRVPYMFAVGNHDVTSRQAVTDPARQPGWTNTRTAMSRMWPPEGTHRRLDGYPTFAFGYGSMFVIAIDSNIAADQTQFAWVARQLETLDRARYRHIVVVFHHPPFSSGPHGGPIVEPQTTAIRELYMPLFRRHRIRMTITGHDHLFEHWVERVVDDRGAHRIDHLVTGGGGAPIYTYRGEPNLEAYIAAAEPLKVSLDHTVKPGPAIEDNPHHYLVIQVDGDVLSIEVVGTGPTPYLPYGRPVMELVDRRS